MLHAVEHGAIRQCAVQQLEALAVETLAVLWVAIVVELTSVVQMPLVMEHGALTVHVVLQKPSVVEPNAVARTCTAAERTSVVQM
jgi:hypothetical protein